jgi:hypothetical protein
MRYAKEKEAFRYFELSQFLITHYASRITYYFSPRLGHWNLKFIWDLVLEIWNFIFLLLPFALSLPLYLSQSSLFTNHQSLD